MQTWRRRLILGLFLFSGDNGEPAPGTIPSNGPPRGAKATLYEGGVRVPAIVAWDGRIEPGTAVTAPLHRVDWYPTLLTLAGVSLDRPLPRDGRDARPAITQGAPSPHDAIQLNAAPQAGAIRVGHRKLIVRCPGADARDDVHATDGNAPTAALPNGSVELFNLAADPVERYDRAASYPKKVAELRARHDALARHAVPPKSAPRGPDFRSPRVWGQRD